MGQRLRNGYGSPETVESCHSQGVPEFHNQLCAAEDGHTSDGRVSLLNKFQLQEPLSCLTRQQAHPPPVKRHFLLRPEPTRRQVEPHGVLKMRCRPGLASRQPCPQAAIELDRRGLQRHCLKAGAAPHSASEAGTNTQRAGGCLGWFLILW